MPATANNDFSNEDPFEPIPLAMCGDDNGDSSNNDMFSGFA